LFFDFPLMTLFLLYSLSVLFCWFLTKKLLLGVLLAVVIDVALYLLGWKASEPGTGMLGAGQEERC
jgi:uncharacterized RDD family membrane protein YckC